MTLADLEMADQYGFQIQAAILEYEAGEPCIMCAADECRSACDDEPYQFMPALRATARRTRQRSL